MTWRLGRSVLVLLAVVLASFSLAQADQPQMREARQHLVAARAALVRADANKGGHRQKAIGLVNSAIAEVDRGIAFDRRHNHAQPSASGAPDQPNMRAALEELNQAKRNLDNATNDKGGHRRKAMDFIDRALIQVNLGIAAAN
jgi:hypothetical protein